MTRPKRNFLATAQETLSPPTALADSQAIARVWKAEGKNLYSVEVPSSTKPLLVELPSRFRSQIWIKRGGYVLVDTSAFVDRDNKLDGEIVNIVRDEKQWRKQSYWHVSITIQGISTLTSCFLGHQSSSRSRCIQETARAKNPPWGRCLQAMTPGLKNEV